MRTVGNLYQAAADGAKIIVGKGCHAALEGGSEDEVSTDPQLLDEAEAIEAHRYPQGAVHERMPSP